MRGGGQDGKQVEVGRRVSEQGGKSTFFTESGVEGSNKLGRE